MSPPVIGVYFTNLLTEEVTGDKTINQILKTATLGPQTAVQMDGGNQPINLLKMGTQDPRMETNGASRRVSRLGVRIITFALLSNPASVQVMYNFQDIQILPLQKVS